MSNSINKMMKNILLLPRYAKRITAIILDIGLCILCTWLAFYLRLEEFVKINDTTIVPILLSIFLAIPIFWLLGLYRAIFRFTGLSIFFSTSIAVFIYSLLYFSIIGIFGIQNVPRSIGLIQPLLLFFGIISSRLLIKHLLSISYSFKDNSKNKKRVLIYGAGSAGHQLLISLENNVEMKVVGFLDDNHRLHNQTILSQTIFSPLKLEKLIKKKNIHVVLLALPSISRNKRNEILQSLNNFSIMVKTLPSVQDIVEGKISVSDIKDLDIGDLLSRPQVVPNYELLSKNINAKVVLVTGAGGSIGSELCRQIIKLNPKKLLLLELNEFVLYKIYEELKYLNKKIEIIPLLVNVQNESRVNEVFATFKVDTVYHAAAYKHVSLVEENICEGVKNNVFGTFIIAQTAIQNSVSNFVLISSDKAVRSTNIMGATKRFAELCVQALYDSNKNTQFSIVRFGNVLESSGSVIPKFKEQIKIGGPVTLTHPDVTRYFMTKTEAAQLVIQAGAMSKSCQVFILDMGQSVKIKDLIYKMIRLSGLKVKDDQNPEGDIEIKVIGLRPGEKLYEELLLGSNPQKTFHKKIQKAQEPHIPFSQLKIDLDILTTLLKENKIAEVKEMLERLIVSYKSNSKIVDHIYNEKSNLRNDNKKLPTIQDKENNVISIKTK
jgi:FlaA1/EpsC-like NDP-sugar epimerase